MSHPPLSSHYYEDLARLYQIDACTPRATQEEKERAAEQKRNIFRYFDYWAESKAVENLHVLENGEEKNTGWKEALYYFDYDFDYAYFYWET